MNLIAKSFDLIFRIKFDVLILEILDKIDIWNIVVFNFAFKLEKLNYTIYINDKVVVFNIKIAELYCKYLE